MRLALKINTPDRRILFLLATLAIVGCLRGQEAQESTLMELREAWAQRSKYRRPVPPTTPSDAQAPRLELFEQSILPVLRQTCLRCHGPDRQKAGIRIDTLAPNLYQGDDVEHWLDVLSVLTNNEMPPKSKDLADSDRSRLIDWLSTEIQSASRARREQGKHSSFRRLTRYEYRYALQDLLGLPFDFARDLPPEPRSADGFLNSSEHLHMTPSQLEVYLEAARKALGRATVQGERPRPFEWSVSMERAASFEWKRQDDELAKLEKKHPKDVKKIEQRRASFFKEAKNRARYLDRISGRTAPHRWQYNGARYAWKPGELAAKNSSPADVVAVIPPGRWLIVELGDRLPVEGTMRVRVRASRRSAKGPPPSLQLWFGWQASNDSSLKVPVNNEHLRVDAAPGVPVEYEWRIPMGEIQPRNLVRGVNKMGDLPSPSEYIRIVNSSVARGDIEIEHVEVAAPIYESWPPTAQQRLFAVRDRAASESAQAHEIVSRFASRAWRRELRTEEIDAKLELFEKLRSEGDAFDTALLEVLATVLASPRFLYVINEEGHDDDLGAPGLATRLALFLWCSAPDDELLALARAGRLLSPDVLSAQVDRMLSDKRSRRFTRHFVRQWLDMELLDFYRPDRKAHPRFPAALKESMGQEPIAFFQEVLGANRSFLDLVHADFAVVDERLARHYGLKDVNGNHFRRVPLLPAQQRGGLLTQAGLLAMNSDGKDSHPLKRGIWLLESILNAPPPPPPPAVPEIDLADPAIAKMTLKERIEHHRDQPACMFCHARIDPWGIAFEEYDAVGKWRDKVAGRPVDARSELFTGQPLIGMKGLKRHLLEQRQDQLARALVHKMTTFALGRPLSFRDRSAVDEITGELRRSGDGLATLVKLIATSDLFLTR